MQIYTEFILPGSLECKYVQKLFHPVHQWKYKCRIHPTWFISANIYTEFISPGSSMQIYTECISPGSLVQIYRQNLSHPFHHCKYIQNSSHLVHQCKHIYITYLTRFISENIFKCKYIQNSSYPVYQFFVTNSNLSNLYITATGWCKPLIF